MAHGRIMCCAGISSRQVTNAMTLILYACNRNLRRVLESESRRKRSDWRPVGAELPLAHPHTTTPWQRSARFTQATVLRRTRGANHSLSHTPTSHHINHPQAHAAPPRPRNGSNCQEGHQACKTSHQNPLLQNQSGNRLPQVYLGIWPLKRAWVSNRYLPSVEWLSWSCCSREVSDVSWLSISSTIIEYSSSNARRRWMNAWGWADWCRSDSMSRQRSQESATWWSLQ